MLNLPIAMLNFAIVLSILFFAQTPQPVILSPQPGETLRGKVQIIGSINLPNFSSAQMAFSYASDPNSWFPLQSFPQPPAEQTLAMWDTTLVTDGDYVLTLRIFFTDGTVQDGTVADLKIRNDEPLPTSTLEPQAEQSPPAATADLTTREPIPATQIFFTPVPLPPNPAALNPPSILEYLARGGFLALILFIFFSLVLRFRKQ